jgi:hypothetical protein
MRIPFFAAYQQLETARDPGAVALMLMASMFLLRIDFEMRVLTYCNAVILPLSTLWRRSDGQILPLRTGWAYSWRYFKCGLPSH